MKIIEFDETCKSCKGTGLYRGLAEKDGAAVVCYNCEGTGCHHVHFEYTPFTHRNEATGVKRVYQTNPGIVIGEGDGFSLADFGGMPIKEWESGLPFIQGMENRKYTCPAWWYQSVDYKRKPTWKECIFGGLFSLCPNFPQKEKCWQRFDKRRA